MTSDNRMESRLKPCGDLNRRCKRAWVWSSPLAANERTRLPSQRVVKSLTPVTHRELRRVGTGIYHPDEAPDNGPFCPPASPPGSRSLPRRMHDRDRAVTGSSGVTRDSAIHKAVPNPHHTVRERETDERSQRTDARGCRGRSLARLPGRGDGLRYRGHDATEDQAGHGQRVAATRSTS